MKGSGLLVKGLLIVLAALTALNLVGLWGVGQRVKAVSDEQEKLAARVQELAGTAADNRTLQESVGRLEEGQGKLSTGFASAAENVAKALGDLTQQAYDLAALRARLQTLEARPQTQAAQRQGQGAPPQPPPGPDDGQLWQVDTWIARMKEDPVHIPRAAQSGFEWRGMAGYAYVLGADRAGQAKLQTAYDGVMARLRAAQKEHSKVAIEGNAVKIELSAFPDEGRALEEEWQNALAAALTPEQRELYGKSHPDRLLFPLGIGDYDVTGTLTWDGKTLTFRRKGQRRGGVGRFDIGGGLGGNINYGKLPERHLLTDEALAALRGAPK